MEKDNLGSDLAKKAFEEFPLEMGIDVRIPDDVDENQTMKEVKKQGLSYPYGIIMYPFSDECTEELMVLFRNNLEQFRNFCRTTEVFFRNEYYEFDDEEILDMAIDNSIDEPEGTIGDELDRLTDCMNNDFNLLKYIIEKKKGYPKKLTEYFEEIGILHNEYMVMKVLKERSENGIFNPFKITTKYGTTFVVRSSDLESKGSMKIKEKKNEENKNGKNKKRTN